MNKKTFISLVSSSLLVLSLLSGCENTITSNTSESKSSSSNSETSASLTGTPANNTDANSTPTTSETASSSNTESSQVKSALNLYEATYFDVSVYGGQDDKIENGVYQMDDYYNVDTSHVTDTSFNFSVYKVDGTTEERSLIFKEHTAVFTGDGTTAVYNGEKYTLNFSFPDIHETHPDIADMQVTGFPPLEGVTLVYNGIPGHEFG